jgi:hypothetical protein
MSNTDRYFDSLSGEEKRNVAFDVVDEIERSGGRFLQRGHRCWIPVSRDDARLKVAQAFQYQRRKNRKNQDLRINLAVAAPPPFLRQSHYMPSFRSPTRATMSQQNVFGRNETDRSGASVNPMYIHNDDALPFVTSLSFETDTNYIPLPRLDNEKRRSSPGGHTNERGRSKVASFQPPRKFHSNVAAMSSEQDGSDRVITHRHVTSYQGKTDPNERQDTAGEVHDLEIVANQLSSSNELERKTSDTVQEKAEDALDASGIHSIGLSSEDEQQSMISVLANMNADTWTTENEDSGSKSAQPHERNNSL